MPKYTRKTIYDTIRKSGLLDTDEQKETAAAIFNEISGILRELRVGDTLELRGIGTFRGKYVNGRKFYNIATKQHEESEGRSSVKFIPSKFVSEISNLDIQEQSSDYNPKRSSSKNNTADESSLDVVDEQEHEQVEITDSTIEEIKIFAARQDSFNKLDLIRNFPEFESDQLYVALDNLVDSKVLKCENKVYSLNMPS